MTTTSRRARSVDIVEAEATQIAPLDLLAQSHQTVILIVIFICYNTCDVGSVIAGGVVYSSLTETAIMDAVPVPVVLVRA